MPGGNSPRDLVAGSNVPSLLGVLGRHDARLMGYLSGNLKAGEFVPVTHTITSTPFPTRPMGVGGRRCRCEGSPTYYINQSPLFPRHSVCGKCGCIPLARSLHTSTFGPYLRRYPRLMCTSSVTENSKRWGRGVRPTLHCSPNGSKNVPLKTLYVVLQPRLSASRGKKLSCRTAFVHRILQIVGQANGAALRTMGNVRTASMWPVRNIIR